MLRFVCTLVVVVITSALAAQEAQKANEDYIKRCTPKVVKRAPLQNEEKAGGPQKGEKPTKYPPVIAFQILESGQVVNARVKRSSGFHFVDNYALNRIKGIQYNSRPGCGVIDSEATASIDWTSDK